VAWYSSWWDSSGSLLYSDLLVVSVDGFLGVYGERAFGLADDTVTEVDFSVVVLVDGAFFLATTIADKPYFLQLRKHLRPPRHYSTDLDHGIQIHLPQISECILNGQSLNLHIDLVMNILITRVPLLSNLEGDLIEIRDDNRRLISNPVR
jgi:hypothetical protein